MKSLFSIIIALVLILNIAKSQTSPVLNSLKKINAESIQKIIDSAHVKGSVLIFDPQQKTLYSNDFDWCNKGFLPASTFKIPNSIIALELGIVKDDSTLFKWNGEKRRLPVWEQDLIFRDAFQYSCVPCYQEIARKTGAEKMQQYLKKLDYGNMKVDSSNIDVFWLEGDSKITQFQQLDFIYRFHSSKLPIKPKTHNIMEKLLFIENTEIGKLSGKTGWAIRNNMNTGWFVGYLEYKNKVYYIVCNIEPEKQFDMDMFPMIRKEITLKTLNIIIKK